MNPITDEWVNKAEGDFATARREFEVLDDPNYDAVCFHAQQCIEKYLKARLQESGIPFGKTHDLSTLPDLMLPTEPTWDALRGDLRALTVFAVTYRYPGDSADESEAREAIERCAKVREIARTSLGLPA
ncbi:MAG TPA: HEPN domain-containing protein [Pyrinomonadaceae bacterium]|nr:HEPN domain-containing protein [Pyrinomonadaceae bacterium]